jgi:hypothetical protein
VALTDMTANYTGNHCVCPLSHILLSELYKQQVVTCNSVYSSPLPVLSKPSLEPLQLILSAGDAFICTHRLAYMTAPNIRNSDSEYNVSGIVYFEASHCDHDVIKIQALDDIWVEYSSYHIKNAISNTTKNNDKNIKSYGNKNGNNSSMNPILNNSNSKNERGSIDWHNMDL